MEIIRYLKKINSRKVNLSNSPDRIYSNNNKSTLPPSTAQDLYLYKKGKLDRELTPEYQLYIKKRSERLALKDLAKHLPHDKHFLMLNEISTDKKSINNYSVDEYRELEKKNIIKLPTEKTFNVLKEISSLKEKSLDEINKVLKNNNYPFTVNKLRNDGYLTFLSDNELSFLESERARDEYFREKKDVKSVIERATQRGIDRESAAYLIKNGYIQKKEGFSEKLEVELKKIDDIKRGKKAQLDPSIVKYNPITNNFDIASEYRFKDYKFEVAPFKVIYREKADLTLERDRAVLNNFKLSEDEKNILRYRVENIVNEQLSISKKKIEELTFDDILKAAPREYYSDLLLFNQLPIQKKIECLNIQELQDLKSFNNLEFSSDELKAAQMRSKLSLVMNNSYSEKLKLLSLNNQLSDKEIECLNLLKVKETMGISIDNEIYKSSLDSLREKDLVSILSNEEVEILNIELEKFNAEDRVNFLNTSHTFKKAWKSGHIYDFRKDISILENIKGVMDYNDCPLEIYATLNYDSKIGKGKEYLLHLREKGFCDFLTRDEMSSLSKIKDLSAGKISKALDVSIERGQEILYKFGFNINKSQNYNHSLDLNMSNKAIINSLTFNNEKRFSINQVSLRFSEAESVTLDRRLDFSNYISKDKLNIISSVYRDKEIINSLFKKHHTTTVGHAKIYKAIIESSNYSLPSDFEYRVLRKIEERKGSSVSEKDFGKLISDITNGTNKDLSSDLCKAFLERGVLKKDDSGNLLVDKSFVNNQAVMKYYGLSQTKFHHNREVYEIIKSNLILNNERCSILDKFFNHTGVELCSNKVRYSYKNISGVFDMALKDDVTKWKTPELKAFSNGYTHYNSLGREILTKRPKSDKMLSFWSSKRWEYVKDKYNPNIKTLLFNNTFKQLSVNALPYLSINQADREFMENGVNDKYIGKIDLFKRQSLPTPNGRLDYFIVNKGKDIFNGDNALSFLISKELITKGPNKRLDMHFHDIKLSESVAHCADFLVMQNNNIEIVNYFSEGVLSGNEKRKIENSMREKGGVLFDAKLRIREKILENGQEKTIERDVYVEYGNYDRDKVQKKLSGLPSDASVYWYSNGTKQKEYVKQFGGMKNVHFCRI